jgi:hypothetical protein
LWPYYQFCYFSLNEICKPYPGTELPPSVKTDS